jgi:4-hydroxy-tetrahydrodipicolinate reductase
MKKVEQPVRVVIHGALGRMGTRLLQLAMADSGLRVAGAIERADHPRLGQDVGPLAGLEPLGVQLTGAMPEGVGAGDVVIDFTAPGALRELIPQAAARGCALVVGTTGLEAGDRALLRAAAERVPVMAASNYSRAVHVLARLVGEAARLLGEAADVEIVERHHRYKQDAPSGTALRLARAVMEARGPARLVHGREGITGERPRGDIGMHALRTGDNPGEHTVVFGLMGECLELSHRALNRDGFVLGALAAAKHLAGKPAGEYPVEEVVFGTVMPGGSGEERR